MKRHDVHAEHMTDMPHPKKGPAHAENLVPADDFKKQAMDIAYGQAGRHGMASDEKKIHAQFKHCYDDPGASGY